MQSNKPFIVRDTRKKEKFVIDDAYLNGYARLCGIYATGVYNCLCRHADYHTQESFPSIESMAEKLNISTNSVKRGIENLVEWNIIAKQRTRHPDNAKWVNNSYTLLDKSVWKPKPVSHSPTRAMESHSPVGTEPQPCSDESHSPVKSSKESHIKVTHSKDTETSQSSVFDWEKSCEKMMKKEGSDMDIIATFLTEKKIVPESREQLTGYIKRYRKTAGLIAPFVAKNFDKFWDSVEMCKEESRRLNYEWNLETVYKKITKI